MKIFKHEYRKSKINSLLPRFFIPLTDLIIELDYLRKKKLGGSTIPHIFFQLKRIFHTLESIGSARIEGNHTTIAEYIEYKIQENTSAEMSVREIVNMEKALDFIDANIEETQINRDFVSELHRLAVDNLPLHLLMREILRLAYIGMGL